LANRSRLRSGNSSTDNYCSGGNREHRFSHLEKMPTIEIVRRIRTGSLSGKHASKLCRLRWIRLRAE
jgi:hypothetical protein